LVSFLASVLFAVPSWATPQPLPFTYVYETLPKGNLEVEQYIDYTPVPVTSAVTGKQILYGASQFQTEFEYGITDRLELGLYAEFAPQGGAATYSQATLPTLTEGNGVKERLRLRLGDEGRWPLDVALYLELVEIEREFEIEAKVILQRRIGDLRIVANLWAEREWEFSNHVQDWVINPTAGATYEVTKIFHPGVEGWMREEFPDGNFTRTFNLGPAVYVGPTAMLDFGKLWWAVGGYALVSDINRVPQVGDGFGRLWVRTIIGLSF
jgi:hypothetical protein